MQNSKIRKIKKVRNKIIGDALRPRLAVFRSLKNISAQLIDDKKGMTIVAASSSELKKGENNIKVAMEVGKILAKKAVGKKITTAVFDRRAYRYIGKVKALADGARAGGLKI